MQVLPENYDAGPMSEPEFVGLKQDEEAEARRHGYHVNVQKVDRNGQIFAHVGYSEDTGAGAMSVNSDPHRVTADTTMPVEGTTHVAGGTDVAMAGGDLATISSSSSLAAAIKDASHRFAVSPVVLATIAYLESGLKPIARNPKSSAFGLFQFLQGTWASIVREHGGAVGVSLEPRSNVAAQCLMGAAYLKDNEVLLKERLDREPTPAECYAAHFFGAGAALRLLTGDLDQSAALALGPKAQQIIGANPSIFEDGGRIRSVKEVMLLFKAKMERAGEHVGQVLGSLG